MGNALSAIGNYDQAVILTQYLINNGLENLWLANANSDKPLAIQTDIVDKPNGAGSMAHVTLSSPRVVLQPESDPLAKANAEIIIFQVRFQAGSLRVALQAGNSQKFTNYNMSGWKIAYKATISPSVLNTPPSKLNAFFSKVPSQSSTSYSITQLNLTVANLESPTAALDPVLSYCDFGSSTDEILQSPQVLANWSILMKQMLNQLKANNMLITGYNATPMNASSVSKSSSQGTLIPTARRLQQYPFTDTLPQPTYGLQGNARMNSLCFLEMTSNNPFPNSNLGTIDTNTAWFKSMPTMLATSSPLSRTGWKLSTDSYQPGSEVQRLIDNDPSSFWHSQYSPKLDGMPHWVIVDMQRTNLINGLSYLPRQDGTPNGTIGKYKIQLSVDGTNYASPAVSGYWANDSTRKVAYFNPQPARYVRLNILSESQNQGNAWASGGDLNIFSNYEARDQWLVRVVSGGSNDGIEPGFEPGKAIDGDSTSFWHSAYSKVTGTYPHRFMIVRQQQPGMPLPTISGLNYIPRQDGTPNGRIGAYRIEIPANMEAVLAAFASLSLPVPSTLNPGAFNTWGNLFRPAAGADVISIASGTWADDAMPKTVSFPPNSSPIIYLVAESEAGGRGPWASAAEINLLNGTGLAASSSSTDMGVFVLSRQNFFDRYLIPKLRMVNAIWESHCHGPKAAYGGSFGPLSATWQCDNLGIGQNDQQPGDPTENSFYDFKPDTLSPTHPIPTWSWSSAWPKATEQSQSVAQVSGARSILPGSTYTAQATCKTESKMSFTPNGSRVTITGVSSIQASTHFQGFTIQDEKLQYALSWTVTLDLAAVADGGLAINVNIPTPLPTISSSNNLHLLAPYPAYLGSCITRALSRFQDFKKSLQQDLAGREKLMLPAAGSFFFKDPMFNSHGDVRANITYNGNMDNQTPNADAVPRDNSIQGGLGMDPVQTVAPQNVAITSNK